MSNTMWCTPSTTTNFNKQMRTKTFQYDEIQLLQAEAQKIRNWHLQTEINAKNMEKVVQNLRMTVESQRKSLLEVQLEYEGIGNKMQEEVNKRTICLQRIDATRDMCNLIKGQACELEDTLHFCGVIKDSIKSNYTEQNDGFLKLISDFSQLSEEFDKAKVQYKDKLFESEQKSLREKEAYLEEIRIQQNKISDCTERLNEKESTIDILVHTVTKEQNELTETKGCIQEINSSKLDLLEMVKQLKLNVQLSDSIKDDQRILLKRKENQVRRKEEQLAAAASTNATLREKLDEERLLLSKTEALHSEDIKELENRLHTETIKAEMLEKLIEEMNVKLKCYSDDLKSMKSSKEDLTATVAQMIDHREALLKKYDEVCENKKITSQSLSQCKDTISQLLKVIDKMRVHEEALEAKLNIASNAEQQVQTELQTKAEENRLLKLEIDESASTISELNSKIEKHNSKAAKSEDKLSKTRSENAALKGAVMDLERKIDNQQETEQKLLSSIQCLGSDIEKEKLKSAETESRVNELIESAKEDKELVRSLKETVEMNEAVIEEQKKAADLATGLCIEKERSKLTETESRMNELAETVKENENLIHTLRESIKKHEEVIENRKKAANVATGLFNELKLISNDQTLELTKLYEDLQKARDELARGGETNRKTIESLKVEHSAELKNLQRKLNCAEDKLSIKEEESVKRKPTVIVHSGSARKRSKHLHFTALTGHDISSDFHESFSSMTIPVEKQSKPRQPPPKHSTPIRRASMPTHFPCSGKKTKSSAKPKWKQPVLRNNAKTPAKKEKVVSKEDHWFDTDRVYGFFD